LKRYLVCTLFALLLTAVPANAAEPALVWSGAKLISPDTIADIDCPTSGFCIAVDVYGNVTTSSNPVGSESDWKAVDVTSSSPRAISCPSSSLCVAVGTDGQMATSSDPSGGAAAWTTTDIPGVAHLGAVDCDTGVCAALDAEGRILLTSNPTGGPGAWSIGEPVGTQLFLSAIDCPSPALCVAVGAENHNLGSGLFAQENIVFTIEDPVGPERKVAKAYLGPRSFIRAISCPSTTFCVAVDRQGEAWSSGDPAGGASAWSNQRVDSQELLTDISCPTTSFCVAVDENDRALTTSTPTGGLEDWAPASIPSGLLNLSCPSISLCVAAGLNEVAVGTPPVPDQPISPPPGAGPSPEPRLISPSWIFLSPKAQTVRDGTLKLVLTCVGPVSCQGHAKVAVPAGAFGKLARKSTGARMVPVASSGFSSFNARRVLSIPLNRRGRKLFEERKQTQAQIAITGRDAALHPFSVRRIVTLIRKGR
jgi:hypothetical protein